MKKNIHHHVQLCIIIFVKPERKLSSLWGSAVEKMRVQLKNYDILNQLRQYDTKIRTGTPETKKISWGHFTCIARFTQKSKVIHVKEKNNKEGGHYSRNHN